MANKNLFASLRGLFAPKANVVNEAGGLAYAFGAEHALAQLAVTGCLQGTFYADDRGQLASIVKVAAEVSPQVLAKTAVYARERGHMKDVPALLLAILSVRDPALFRAVFDRVITDGKMLRTFVQIVRSGATGRKSLGTRPKKEIARWLDLRSDEDVFHASVGDDPSMADVLKLVHPKPKDASRRALYAYLIGKEHDAADLPANVQALETWRKLRDGAVPDVPFQLLTAMSLGTAEWVAIAKRASWQTTRMNLATFHRHGVFEVPGMPELVATRLRDPALIARSRVFPYQLLVAYLATRGTGLPRAIEDALHDAVEASVANVPELSGDVHVFVDVSGSMRSPVTGHKKGATTAAMCVDVAALLASAVLRKVPSAKVVPFDTAVRDVQLEPRDTILTNAQRLGAVGGGGTTVSAPFAALNARKAKADLVIVVSDNQSWLDGPAAGDRTKTLVEWNALKERCPKAKLVCVDLQPYTHTQAPDREDILNVGGFSDRVFDVIAAFASAPRGKHTTFVDHVHSVVL